MWWFFALIMLASYTANLAAFLTTDRMTPTINSAEDLAKQTKVTYGAYASGSTRKFFKESNFPIYARMGTIMEADPSLFTETNTEGANRVFKGDYAFFMESIPMEYITIKNCSLQRVGDLLDSKGYGVALPIGEFSY